MLYWLNETQRKPIIDKYWLGGSCPLFPINEKSRFLFHLILLAHYFLISCNYYFFLANIVLIWEGCLVYQDSNIYNLKRTIKTFGLY